MVLIQLAKEVKQHTAFGPNIKVLDSAAFGGLTAGTNGAAPTMTNGTYEMNTVGPAFSFSRKFYRRR